ncbi:MAG: hypothetical protein ACK5O2_01885 [Microthrixaceae bacterium]
MLVWGGRINTVVASTVLNPAAAMVSTVPSRGVEHDITGPDPDVDRNRG